MADTILIYNEELIDKSISVLIREVDTKKRERDYAASKFPEYYEWLDLEARKAFYEWVRAETLKCVTDYNHYGFRDKKINNNLMDEKCPRCQQRETWDHVILYEAIELMKAEYMQTLRTAIKKVNEYKHLSDQIE